MLEQNLATTWGGATGSTVKASRQDGQSALLGEQWLHCEWALGTANDGRELLCWDLPLTPRLCLGREAPGKPQWPNLVAPEALSWNLQLRVQDVSTENSNFKIQLVALQGTRRSRARKPRNEDQIETLREASVVVEAWCWGGGAEDSAASAPPAPTVSKLQSPLSGVGMPSPSLGNAESVSLGGWPSPSLGPSVASGYPSPAVRSNRLGFGSSSSWTKLFETNCVLQVIPAKTSGLVGDLARSQPFTFEPKSPSECAAEAGPSLDALQEARLRSQAAELRSEVNALRAECREAERQAQAEEAEGPVRAVRVLPGAPVGGRFASPGRPVLHSIQHRDLGDRIMRTTSGTKFCSRTLASRYLARASPHLLFRMPPVAGLLRLTCAFAPVCQRSASRPSTCSAMVAGSLRVPLRSSSRLVLSSACAMATFMQPRNAFTQTSTTSSEGGRLQASRLAWSAKMVALSCIVLSCGCPSMLLLGSCRCLVTSLRLWPKLGTTRDVRGRRPCHQS